MKKNRISKDLLFNRMAGIYCDNLYDKSVKNRQNKNSRKYIFCEKHKYLINNTMFRYISEVIYLSVCLCCVFLFCIKIKEREFFSGFMYLVLAAIFFGISCLLVSRAPEGSLESRIIYKFQYVGFFVQFIFYTLTYINIFGIILIVLFTKEGWEGLIFFLFIFNSAKFILQYPTSWLNEKECMRYKYVKFFGYQVILDNVFTWVVLVCVVKIVEVFASLSSSEQMESVKQGDKNIQIWIILLSTFSLVFLSLAISSYRESIERNKKWVDGLTRSIDNIYFVINGHRFFVKKRRDQLLSYAIELDELLGCDIFKRKNAYVSCAAPHIRIGILALIDSMTYESQKEDQVVPYIKQKQFLESRAM